MTVNGLSSALSAITRQTDAADRAATKIARIDSSTEAPRGPAPEASSDSVAQLAAGTVEMMVARRMFTAAVKMAQTMNEGIAEAIRVGDYGVAA